MRFPIVIGAMALLASATPALAQVPAAAIERAVGARQEARHIRVDGRHDFHIKPVQVRFSEEGGQRLTHVQGQLSHILRARPDDQYYYSFTLTPDGMLVDYSEQINRGGFRSILRRVPGAATVGRAVRVLGSSPPRIVTDLANFIGRGFGQGNGWEVSARNIAAAVAIRVASGR
jgi:hypothetical protein